MSLPPTPAPLTDADYEAIAAAVLETARGRWFLSEHARRNRQADTRLVLKAIERLESAISEKASAVEADRMQLNLVDMMNAIMRTKAEIAVLKPAGEQQDKIDSASLELDAIVETTEKATSDILAAAERIQEIAWTMREQGIEPAVCDLIDAHTTEVYTACSFQDLTGQRIRKIIQVLRFLEARIDAMMKIWRLDELEMVSVDEVTGKASLTNDPAKSDDGLKQGAVDNLLDVQKREDVVWEESRKHGAPASNLADYNLDDLQVIDAPMEQAKTATAVAPSLPPPPAETLKEPVARGDGIGSLMPAERQALFS